MWIGLLGPMEVRNSTGDVRVTAPKLRSVLAILAIHAGNVVSMESLAEAVWDGDWPAKWPETLRNNVKKIRQALAPDTSRIEWRAPGYVLRLGPDESDLATFESMRKAGLAAALSGDWRDASALLTRAESLWRGTAFADIESRLIRTQHAHYLQTQRVAVAEARIEADIRLSLRGSAAAVTDLQRLLAYYPERERLCTLAMLAMYRAGRQAEALGVYRQARRRLASDHGIEPGPELADMHDRILAADPAMLGEPLTDAALRLSIVG
jgi:DNA-binding SARP family transcriptional activator